MFNKTTRTHVTLIVSLAAFSACFASACGSTDDTGGSSAGGAADAAVSPDAPSDSSAGGASEAGRPDADDAGYTDSATDASSGDSSSSDAAPDAGPSDPCASYGEPVTIPPYDANNKAHFLIETVDDWKHINDADKRVFYVKPGLDYGPVKVTSSGTASAPRIIALHDSSDKHPAQLPVGKQASVRLVFQGVSYWIVHRMSALDYANDAAMSIQSVSHDIIVDRMNFSNFGTAVGVAGRAAKPTTRNITIQHCRMDHMSTQGINGDRVAVILAGSSGEKDYAVEDVHVIDNEVRNCNDGFMLLWHDLPGGQHVNYPGTVVACNQFYVDSDVYTDGTGKLDPNGRWALTENAIDLKGGSDDPNRPVVVAYNKMWGYRHTDKYTGGSGDWGVAFGGHYDVKNLEVFGNVVFDSNRGLAFADPHGFPYSVENLHAYSNIFYNIGFSTGNYTEFCHYFYASKNVVYEHNTVVGVDKHSTWFSHNNDEEGMRVHCNAIVDSAKERGQRASGTVVDSNFFYGTERAENGDGQVFSAASDAHLEDLVFTADRFTNSPRKITLPGVVTTSQSPHAGWCK